MQMIAAIAGFAILCYLVFCVVVITAIIRRWPNKHKMSIFWGWSTAAVVLMALIIPNVAPEQQQKQAQTQQPKVEQPVSVMPVKVAPPVESRAEYVKTAKRIGERGDAIYYKAFAKNPDKYSGERVKVSLKVFKIEEQGGKTLMNVYLSRDLEPGIVYYDGETDVYDGDVVMVYGEVLGRYEGQNALGASMTWPAIHARYIKKMKYEE